MPASIAAPVRQRIVELALQHIPLGAIATSLHLSYHTVRHLWRRYRDHGPEGLTVHTHRCGRRPLDRFAPARELACQLKKDHPTWGAGFIRIQLKEKFSSENVPSVRSLQLAFLKAGVHRPRRARRPRQVLLRAQFPHDVWQVDAVEKKHLANGQLVSGLTITDEASGAVLETPLSPPGAMARDRSTGCPRDVS